MRPRGCRGTEWLQHDPYSGGHGYADVGISTTTNDCAIVTDPGETDRKLKKNVRFWAGFEMLR